MPDFLGMMKQAAQLQSKMQAMQEELGNVEVEGLAGGGLVAVRMNAKMDVKGVKIDPSLIKPEEVEILEEARATLRPGKNTIAVHCHQYRGGQYIDVGIVDVKEEKPDAPKLK